MNRETISRTQLFQLAALIVIVGAVLFPVLNARFVDWDENLYIINNPTIKSFTWDNIKRIFLKADLKLYTPLVTFSYALEYRFFGLDPMVFHGINLLLHIFNTLLVYCFAALLGLRARACFAAALLFGVHPMHVESVAWVPERKDVLYAWFYLFSSCTYLLWAQTGEKKWYRIALVSFLFSLFSKPMAVTLPVVLLLLDYWEGRKFTVRMLAEKIPFALFAGVFAGALAFFNVTDPEKSYRVDWLWMALLPLHNLFFYFKKLLWPSDLSAVYACAGGLNVVAAYAVLSLSGLVALWRWGRQSRLAVFCTLYGLISVLPVLQIMKFGPVIVADRYSYLPSLGLFIAAAVLFDAALERLDGRRVWRTALLCLGICGAGTLAYMAHQRCKAWEFNISLWGDTLKKVDAQMKRGKAWPVLGRASAGDICSNSAMSMTYQNYATSLLTQGRDDQAAEYYLKALDIGPRAFAAMSNLSLIYAKKKEYDKALKYAESALELQPGVYQIYANMANLYYEKGRPDLAEDYLKRAIMIQPRDARLYLNLGLQREHAGKSDKAEEAYRKAIELDPRYPGANLQMCILEYKRKRLAEAFPYCRMAYMGGLSVPDTVWDSTSQAAKALAEKH
ncbi:MAG: tetratricopeptide repeat protein [Elusimicrobia bacterium]|nr:tetratricopeptide repeat protein [Elusimicrobiota bacterium]